MRILRGLTSRLLSCGCVIGVYETYDGETVGIIDARKESCTDPAHMEENIVPLESSVRARGTSPSGGDDLT